MQIFNLALLHASALVLLGTRCTFIRSVSAGVLAHAISDVSITKCDQTQERERGSCLSHQNATK